MGITDLFTRSIRPTARRHHPERERPGAEPARLGRPRPAGQSRRPGRRRGSRGRSADRPGGDDHALGLVGLARGLVAAALEQPRSLADRHRLDVRRSQRLRSCRRCRPTSSTRRRRSTRAGWSIPSLRSTRPGRSSPSSSSGITRRSARPSCSRRPSTRPAGRPPSTSCRRGRSRSTWTRASAATGSAGSSSPRTSCCTFATRARPPMPTATARSRRAGPTSSPPKCSGATRTGSRRAVGSPPASSRTRSSCRPSRRRS